MNKTILFSVPMCAVFALNTSVLAEKALPSFEVTTTADNVKKGESVYVLVDLEDNIGFGALQLQMSYDADKLLLDEVTSGAIITDGAITSVNSDIVGEINFSAISVSDITESGTVLVSKFTAKDDGEALLDLKLLAYADSGGTSLDATVTDSKIIIESENRDLSGNTAFDGGNSNGGSNGSAVNGSNGSSHSSDKSSEEKNEGTGKTDENALPKNEKAEAKQVFADVPDTHWAKEYIARAVEMKIVSGYGNGEFMPDNEMTRAEFATVLWNVAGKPDATEAPSFGDVSESDWFYKQVAWGYGKGIISGTSEEAFSPNDKLTREQAMTILYRYSGSPEAESMLDGFIDGGNVSDYAKSAMSWAISNGIVTGLTETELSPQTSATRAQLATIMVRFLQR